MRAPRRWLAVAALVVPGLLCACLPAVEGGDQAPHYPTPLAHAALADGAVVVAGPEGYCVDPVTLGRRTDRAFAVLASCNILSGGELGSPVPPVMITVTVAPGSRLPAPEALAREAGAEALRSLSRGGLSAVQLSEGGNRVLPDGDARYWRATFLQGADLVGLALYAPEGSALSGEAGFGMLQAVQRRIAALSPSAKAPTP